MVHGHEKCISVYYATSIVTVVIIQYSIGTQRRDGIDDIQCNLMTPFREINYNTKVFFQQHPDYFRRFHFQIIIIFWHHFLLKRKSKWQGIKHVFFTK